MPSRKPAQPRPLVIVLLLALAALLVVFLRPRPEAFQAGADPVPSAKSGGTPGVVAATKPVALRPLAVVQAGRQHEWTSENAMQPEVIEKISHNPEEFMRMVEENDRIQRRQLVYRKEPAWHTVEQSKGKGEPIRKLMLPSLDGRELEFEVTSVDLAPSGLSGTFAGHLPGKLKSLVTLAFDRGREAFTVLSPEDGLYLQGHPREPGELIVTSFDPAIYQPVSICEPIITSK